MNIIVSMILRLLPLGSAWKVITGCIKGFTFGTSLEFVRLKDFFFNSQIEFIPDSSVDLIEEWYEALGLSYNGTLPLADLQAKAKAFDIAVGAQDIVYLQGLIDDADIDVILIELIYPEATRTGSVTARCGIAFCQGNIVEVFSEASGITGVGRTGLARTGGVIVESTLLFHYLVTGNVRNREEFTVLIALLQKFAPGHLVPIFDVELLSDFARCGVATCGISRTGKD